MRRPAATPMLLLALLVLVPLAFVTGLVAAGLLASSSGRGRDYVIRLTLPPAHEIGLPPVEGPLDPGRPLVVIDAGHGGRDPGAGSADMPEKQVTLALADALRRQLLAEGGVRVALTRSDDRFLLLPERSGMARRLGADLFISIHADSADNLGASGATLYTLSDRGSSDEAARLAAKENRADTINGVSLTRQSDAVNAILVDLAQRESVGLSEQFARLVLREGAGRLRFRPQPLQSAAFVVLKTPDMASVLFEAGYISNEQDAAALTSDEGREAFARVTARAIRVFFARQLTGA